jgi:hypothetical protein
MTSPFGELSIIFLSLCCDQRSSFSGVYILKLFPSSLTLKAGKQLATCTYHSIRLRAYSRIRYWIERLALAYMPTAPMLKIKVL